MTKSENSPMTEDQIKHMVDRFLGWRLPEDFRPDNGISFKPTFNDHLPTPTRCDPSGTNLFDARQADAMVRYMVEGLRDDAAGCAERDVGRYLYQRLETLMDANSTAAELTWIAHIIGCVEEYGIEHCKGDELMAFPA